MQHQIDHFVQWVNGQIVEHLDAKGQPNCFWHFHSALFAFGQKTIVMAPTMAQSFAIRSESESGHQNKIKGICNLQNIEAGNGSPSSFD
jgi:hypothetical protein